MNMGCVGLRVDGTTYWLTNEGGAYSNVTQTYETDNNVVRTAQTFTAGSISVEQYDFCPKGVDLSDRRGRRAGPWAIHEAGAPYQ